MFSWKGVPLIFINTFGIMEVFVTDEKSPLHLKDPLEASTQPWNAMDTGWEQDSPLMDCDHPRHVGEKIGQYHPQTNHQPL